MKRLAAIKVGSFRDPLAIAEDFDICLRLSEVGRVANLPQVLVYYRQHLASTANAGRGKTYTLSRIVRELAADRRATGSDKLQRGEPLEIHFENLPSVKKNAAETHARWAWWALASGHLGTARKYAWQTLREAPFSVGSWRLLACAIRGH
jgi:GT2 family glycosyltransferase